MASASTPRQADNGLTSFGFLDDTQDSQETSFALGTLFSRVRSALGAGLLSDPSAPDLATSIQSTQNVPRTTISSNGTYVPSRPPAIPNHRKAAMARPIRGLSNIDEHPEASISSPPSRSDTFDSSSRRQFDNSSRTRGIDHTFASHASSSSGKNRGMKTSGSLTSLSSVRSYGSSSTAGPSSSRGLPLMLRNIAPAPAITFTSHAVATNTRSELAGPASSYNDDRDSVYADDGDMDPDTSRDTFSILRAGNESVIDRSHLAKHGWSAIPGFPLSKDILADDMRSLRSGSTRMHLAEHLEDLPSRSAAQAGLQTSADAIVHRMRGEGLSRKFWMADENAKECRECLTVFTPFRRKHHCRICGQIFCGRCAAHIMKGRRFDYEGMIRVCNFCKRMLEEYDRRDQESHRQQKLGTLTRRASLNPNRIQPDKDMISAPLEAQIKSPQAQFAANHLFASANAGPSAFPYGLSHLPSHTSTLSQIETDRVDRNGTTLQAVSKKAKRPEVGPSAPFRKGMDEDDMAAVPEPEIEADTSQLTDANVSDPATKPAQSHPPPSSKVDAHASATKGESSSIAFPSSDSHASLNPAAIQSTYDYPRLRLVSETARPIQRSRMRSLRTIAGLDPAQASALIRSRFEHAPRPETPTQNGGDDETPPAGLPASRNTALEFYKELRICPEGITPALLEASITHHALDHLRKMMEQTLSRSGVSNVQKWLDVLLPFVLTTVSRVKPNAREDHSQDIREFVKIKRIPGGRPDDSEYVDGYVCTKHVATKRMAALMPLTNARIIVIRFALDYHRGASQFMSLEPLIAQEREYMRILVARIVALRPQIVVVEKAVSRTALELLEKEGIIVVRNVKPDAIRAISRCTQADIITSIDRLSLDPRIGRCRFFNVETFQHASSSGWKKSFMRFEGTPKQLGCTIVLRGADGPKLSQVKKILVMMVFVAYSLRMEEHVMADEGARMETIYSDMGPVNGCLPCGTLDGVAAPQAAHPIEEIGVEDHVLTGNQESDSKATVLKARARILRALTIYQTTLITSSACINIPAPYPILRLKEESDRLLELIAQREAEELDRILKDEGKLQPASITEIPSDSAPAEAEITASSHDAPPSATSIAEAPAPSDLGVTKPRKYDTIVEESEENGGESPAELDTSSAPGEGHLAAVEKEELAGDKVLIEAPEHVDGPNTTTPTPRPSSPVPIATVPAKSQSVSASAPVSEAPSRITSPALKSSTFASSQGSAGAPSISALVQSKLPVFDLFSLLKAPSEVAKEAEYSIVLQQHKNRVQEWGRYLDIHPESVTPFNHARLQIIVTRHCTLAPKPCDGPKLEAIEFYGERDETLGGHLERLAANSAQSCQAKGCGKNNVLHYNTYVHNQIRIQVVLERFVCPLPNEENRLLSWSYCKVCENATPVALVTAETWSYSFAKYLELYFYRHDHCKTTLCEHDFYRDQVRYFAYQNMAVRFHSEVLDLYEVSMPQTKLFISPAIQCNIKNEETAAFTRKNQAYWDSVLARIRALGNDACSDAAGVNKDRNRAIMADMVRRCEADRRDIESLIGKLYEFSPTTDVLCLNQARRVLQEKVVRWDIDFIEFEKTCIPSEKDLRRITSTHLKRLFSEKDPSEVRSESAMHVLPPATEVDEALSETAETKAAIATEETSTSVGNGVSAKAAEALGLVGADLSALPMLPGLLHDSAESADRRISPLNMSETQSEDEKGTRANSLPVRPKLVPSLTGTSGRSEPKPFRDGDLDDETDTADLSPVEARPTLSKRSMSNPATASSSPSYSFNNRSYDPSQFPRADESSCTESELAGTVTGLIRRFDSPRRSNTGSSIALDAASARNPVNTLSRRPTLRRGKTEDPEPSQGRVPSSRRKEPADDDSESGALPAPPSPSTARSRLPRAKRTDSGNSVATGRRSGTATPTTTQSVPPPTSYRPPVGKGLKAGPRPIIGRSGASASATMAADKGGKAEGAAAGFTLSVHGSRVPVARRGDDGPGTRSRVSTIAKHFDRISKEAERERERQHRLLLAQRAKRARPVAVTRARVEVFSSVREAVRDDESEPESAVESSGDESASGADNEDEEEDSEDDITATRSPRKNADESPRRGGHQDEMSPRVGTKKSDMTEPEQDGGDTIKKSDSAKLIADMADADRDLTLKGKRNAAAALSGTGGDGALANQEPFNVTRPSAASELESDAHSIAASSMTTSTMPLTLPSYLRNGFTSDSDSMPSLERSFLKTLSGFWAFRPGDMVPLEYPMLNSEHVFADSDIIFREDEPSSIIAFTLSSKQYMERLKSMRNEKPTFREKEETFMPDNSDITEKDGWGIVDIEENQLESVLKKEGRHFRCEFESGSTRLWCKILFAEQFDALRRTCGCDTSVIESLSRCFKWDSSGGKSGSAFLKTRDHRFVVKQLSRFEMDAFSKFAPQYFTYMSQCVSRGRKTTLAKIFGCFRIGFRNPQTGKNIKLDCFVMENLFYGLEGIRSYDLKGSTRNRYIQETGKENEVLLDENLVENSHLSPIFIREHSKKLLRASLYNDSLFLADMNVMDYSLMVGIDKKNDRLVVGIIDFVRTYTWDKRVESFVKETALLGGAGKGEPTIITPPDYRTRFLTFIDKSLLLMPDHWIENWAL